MKSDVNQWSKDLQNILDEFFKQVPMKSGQVLVIGCSTSEIIGKRIGTAGALDIAEMVFNTFMDYAQKLGIHLAFQCCEHLNRALVVSRTLAAARGWEEVSVVPVRHAGGAMAAYAFRHLEDPAVVEFVRADAGVDIGDTFIGMHLKHVAVPVRVSVNQIGSAHVTMVSTRPKLIGGVRAVYTIEEAGC